MDLPASMDAPVTVILGDGGGGQFNDPVDTEPVQFGLESLMIGGKEDR